MAVAEMKGPAEARAEYDQATKNLLFTKDFNESLEAIIHDPLETAGQRVFSWIKRKSWGNYCLYAVQDDGTPASQADCCSELGIHKQRVSASVAYYERRGYLRREGKLLYPVLAPRSGPPPEKVTHSPDFLEFLELWKVTHSADFEELEVARSTVKRLGKVVLSSYKKWRTLRTNGTPSISESLERTERESQSVSPLSVNDQDRTDPTDLTPILQAFEQIGQTGVDDQEAEQILALTQEAAPELALTAEDVAQAVIDRGTNLSSAIKSPVRFLRADIPRFVKSQTFQSRIATQRSRKPAQTPCEYESPPPQDEDPVVSTRQCGKCGGTVDIYQSGNEGFCRCAIGRLAAARGMP